MDFLDYLAIVGFIIDVIGFVSLLISFQKKSKTIEDRLVKIETIRAGTDLEKTKYSADIELQKVFADKLKQISIKDLIELIKDPVMREFIEKNKKSS